MTITSTLIWCDALISTIISFSATMLWTHARRLTPILDEIKPQK